MNGLQRKTALPREGDLLVVDEVRDPILAELARRVAQLADKVEELHLQQVEGPSHQLNQRDVATIQRLARIFESMESTCLRSTVKIIATFSVVIAILHIDDITLWLAKLLKIR